MYAIAYKIIDLKKDPTCGALLPFGRTDKTNQSSSDDPLLIQLIFFVSCPCSSKNRLTPIAVNNETPTVMKVIMSLSLSKTTEIPNDPSPIIRTAKSTSFINLSLLCQNCQSKNYQYSTPIIYVCKVNLENTLFSLQIKLVNFRPI